MKSYRLVAIAAAILVFLPACSGSVTIDERSQSSESRSTVAAVEPTAEAAPQIVQDDPTSVPAPTATTAPVATPTVIPSPVPEPTPTVLPTPVPTLAAVADVDHSGLAGVRGLTLQWISWEPSDWGSIEFTPLVDGSYAVSGTQQLVDDEYVSVEGSLVRVNEQELLFSGTVTTLIAFANGGEPCVRSGDITFLATGDRRFWRMQDLLNCDGELTDYVDIYFG